jgi:hypothetical protein
MGYILIQAENKETLEKEVNEKLKNGFNPIGSISVVLLTKPSEFYGSFRPVNELRFLYTQPMLKN